MAIDSTKNLSSCFEVKENFNDIIESYIQDEYISKEEWIHLQQLLNQDKVCLQNAIRDRLKDFDFTSIIFNSFFKNGQILEAKSFAHYMVDHSKWEEKKIWEKRHRSIPESIPELLQKILPHLPIIILRNTK